MTVAELLKELEKYPRDTKVYVDSGEAVELNEVIRGTTDYCNNGVVLSV